jgi:hypothetical protein
MKFISKMLCITLLFATGAANAKKRGAAAAPKAQAQAGPTLKGLRDNALRTNPINNSQKLFDNNFVTKLAADVEKAGLGSDALEMILGAVAAKYLQFTGNNDDDRMILDAVNQQISNASKW